MLRNSRVAYVDLEQAGAAVALVHALEDLVRERVGERLAREARVGARQLRHQRLNLAQNAASQNPSQRTTRVGRRLHLWTSCWPGIEVDLSICSVSFSLLGRRATASSSAARQLISRSMLP